MKKTLLVALVSTFLLSGCELLKKEPQTGLPTGTASISGKTFQIEFAESTLEVIRGLQHRKSIESGTGMFFIQDREMSLSFWMKETYIPLDILFFDSELRFINGHYNAQPCVDGGNCPSYASELPSQYVLEVPAGEGQNLNLAPGDILKVSRDQ